MLISGGATIKTNFLLSSYNLVENNFSTKNYDRVMHLWPGGGRGQGKLLKENDSGSALKEELTKQGRGRAEMQDCRQRTHQTQRSGDRSRPMLSTALCQTPL